MQIPNLFGVSYIELEITSPYYIGEGTSFEAFLLR